MAFGNHLMGTNHDPSGKLGGPGYHAAGAASHIQAGHAGGTPGQLAAKLQGEAGVRNPKALAAAIDRRIRSHQAGGATRTGTAGAA